MTETVNRGRRKTPTAVLEDGNLGLVVSRQPLKTGHLWFPFLPAPEIAQLVLKLRGMNRT